MKKVSKTAALLLPAMLFLISISTENYCRLFNSLHENAKSEDSDSFYSINKSDLFFLNRTAQNPVISVKKLPASNINDHTKYLYTSSLSSKAELLFNNSDYLTYTVTVYRNLSPADIIFPFQYFW